MAENRRQKTVGRRVEGIEVDAESIGKGEAGKLGRREGKKAKRK